MRRRVFRWSSENRRLWCFIDFVQRNVDLLFSAWRHRVPKKTAYQSEGKKVNNSLNVIFPDPPVPPSPLINPPNPPIHRSTVLYHELTDKRRQGRVTFYSVRTDFYFDVCLSASDAGGKLTLCHDIKCLQTHRGKRSPGRGPPSKRKRQRFGHRYVLMTTEEQK